MKIDSGLPWEKLAAIPETFATAWTCLFRNLELKKGGSLLIRGATSSLGQAALKLAVNAGAEVIATTRNEARMAKLTDMGARRVEVESRDLSERLQGSRKIDAVLNLVGNSVLLDSMKLVRRGGHMCLAGFLGLAPIEFNPLLQMPSGVHFSIFGSFTFETPEFLLSDVPLQSIIEDVENGILEASPSRVFSFEEIREAHRLMESNEANGKMVVKV
jgi:NADPH:quinone reductase